MAYLATLAGALLAAFIISRLARCGRIGELVESMGQIGELRLLVMVSMLMADELFENAGTAGTGDDANGRDAAEAEMARGIDAVAQRIETIAAGIEQA